MITLFILDQTLHVCSDRIKWWNPAADWKQSQPLTTTIHFGRSWCGPWCQGLSLKVLVARCQGFWNRGDGRVVQNSCRRHFMMVLDHHKQSGRALFPSFWKIWWFGYSYGQYHPTIGDTVNDCIRRPEYKASYTSRIANLTLNMK